MFGGLFNIVFTDYRAHPADLDFMEKGSWLQDSAVTYHVYKQKGRWKVAMTFGWTKYPLRFICRYIDHDFDSEARARIYATYYSRSSVADKRGTLIITANDFSVNYN